MGSRDPWLVLGVLPGASDAEVRAAWRKISKKLHPDLGGDAHEFREALTAYRALMSRARWRSAEPRDYSSDVDWDIAPWLVEPAYTSWGYRPRRSVLVTLAIGMAILTMVVVSLTPALMALPR